MKALGIYFLRLTIAKNLEARNGKQNRGKRRRSFIRSGRRRMTKRKERLMSTGKLGCGLKITLMKNFEKPRNWSQAS